MTDGLGQLWAVRRAVLPIAGFLTALKAAAASGPTVALVATRRWKPAAPWQLHLGVRTRGCRPPIAAPLSSPDLNLPTQNPRTARRPGKRFRCINGASPAKRGSPPFIPRSLDPSA